MAAIDKAAIAWTIAIVAVGAGFAIAGLGIQDSPASTDYTPAKDAVMGEDVMEETMMEDVMEETEMEDAMMAEDATEGVMIEEPLTEEATGPQTVIVTIPQGTSVAGCETTNECYIPASVAVNAGDTVSWDNIDVAAHTVTSGTVPSGPDDLFDSNLLLGGNTFEVTFDSPGSYDYFCLVHPWMIGSVQVS